MQNEIANQITQQIIQNGLIAFSLIVNVGITWFLHFKTKLDNQKESLDRQLVEIQRISLENPFLEDTKFTQRWDELKEAYLNNTISESDKDCFLKYDIYTEMLFNFLEKSYKIYNTEEKLTDYVNFKLWIRTHEKCWKNPLEPHSNRESYVDEVCNIVDKWLK